MVTYTVLLALMPCTWISYIWDQVTIFLIKILIIVFQILTVQIIDPEFDLEHIEQPDNRLINAFYQVASLPIHEKLIYFIIVMIMMIIIIMIKISMIMMIMMIR